METDQVSLALSCVIETEFCEVAVARIDVVQINVLNRSSKDSVARNSCRREQEQSSISHEVLDVRETECSLNCDVCRSEIVVCIEDVSKANDLGDFLLHGCKLIEHKTLRLCECGLPCSGCACQRSGVQECVELSENHVLQGSKECIIGLLDCDLCAVLDYVLDRYCLCVLLNGNISLCRLNDGCLAVRDDLTSINSTGFKCYACGIGNE